jgi:DNA-binding CsgD family transcriptional regulator
MAMRSVGLAAGGGSPGIDRLSEAVTILEATPAKLECARAQVDLGAALRRHGSISDARRVLSRAMELAYRCGATALARRARDELQATGARPRRYVLRGVESLTPSERRVAELAAAGRTNREVAQALFVTPKAIEYHLANAYRKLDIESRQELSGALGTAGSRTI